MAFQDTDLFVINRGGVNYKISYVDLINKTGVQSTDLLMLQRDAALYNVSYAGLGSTGQPIEETDYFLIERDGELFAKQATGMAVGSPCMILTLNNGAAPNTSSCLVFDYTGARSINGVPPQIRTTTTGDAIFLSSGSGKVTLTSAQCAPNMQIYGAFDNFNFRSSSGLTGHSTVNFSAADYNTIMPTPSADFGRRLYKDCPLLTISDINAPVGSMRECFSGCTSFNMSGINSMNVAGVAEFSECFAGCTSFDQPLSLWDITSGRFFSSMFNGCSSFNQNLNPWGSGITTGTYMDAMFKDCTVYNQPMDLWKDIPTTLQSGGLNSFIRDAAAFSQDLSGWCVTNFTSEPLSFSDGSAITPAQMPVWGTCP